MDGELAYEREVFVRLLNGARQWVSIKLFALPREADDYTVLEKLIGHVRYRDSYCTAEFEEAEPIHGPYWRYAITPELFHPASAADAETLLRTFAEYYGPLPDANLAELEAEVYPRIRTATGRYQLPDIRAAAEHDWGWVLGSTGFHEFVLIDRGARSVALMVASDD